MGTLSGAAVENGDAGVAIEFQVYFLISFCLLLASLYSLFNVAKYTKYYPLQLQI